MSKRTTTRERQNRRAEEKYKRVFAIESGETDLVTVAIGRQQDSTIVVEREGLLRLAGS